MTNAEFQKKFDEILTFYDFCFNWVTPKTRMSHQAQCAWHREFEEFIVECDDEQADRALRIYLFHIRGGHKKDVQQLHG
jgi:hypothetical protein